MSDNRTLEFLKGLIIGGAIGAVAALLYAPKSGRETREELSEKAEDLYARAREEYEDTVERARQTYDKTMGVINSMETETKEKVENFQEVAGDILEKGRDRVDNSTAKLKEAIDAAKNAFREERDGMQTEDTDDDEKDA